MIMNNQETAKLLAEKVKNAIAANTDNKITHNNFVLSYQLHIALEAIAVGLEVDKAWFKKECGIGQPLAYFI